MLQNGRAPGGPTWYNHAQCPIFPPSAYEAASRRDTSVTRTTGECNNGLFRHCVEHDRPEPAPVSAGVPDP